jgi:CheY-like chemotaxis protein
MGKTILVVDDEVVLGKVIGETLAMFGYEAIVCENGEEALSYLNIGQTVDALITDFLMPGMTGDALVKEAKNQRPDMPAAIITGTLRMVPEDHLADKVIGKPFMIGEVLGWLREVGLPADEE